MLYKPSSNALSSSPSASGRSEASSSSSSRSGACGELCRYLGGGSSELAETSSAELAGACSAELSGTSSAELSRRAVAGRCDACVAGSCVTRRSSETVLLLLFFSTKLVLHVALVLLSTGRNSLQSLGPDQHPPVPVVFEIASDTL